MTDIKSHSDAQLASSCSSGATQFQCAVANGDASMASRQVSPTGLLPAVDDTRSAPEWGKSSLKCTGANEAAHHHQRAPCCPSFASIQLIAALRETALDLIAPLHSTDSSRHGPIHSAFVSRIPSIPSSRSIHHDHSHGMRRRFTLIRWHSASPPGRPHPRHNQLHTDRRGRSPQTATGHLSPPPGRVPCDPHNFTAITKTRVSPLHWPSGLDPGLPTGWSLRHHYCHP